MNTVVHLSRVVMVELAPSDQVFEPFGAIVRRPDDYGERRFYSDWLGGEGLTPVFHVNRVAATLLPSKVNRLERHPHAAQCFVPLDVERYLVTVAPTLADGTPDLSNLRSFLFPRSLGVIYRSDVWHAPASALERPAAFAVLMWRGRQNDDEFCDIPPVTLAMEGLKA